MKVIIINNTSISDPKPQTIKSLYETPGEGIIYVSHELPPDRDNWLLIDYKDLLTYSKTHNLFLKTARISHQRMLFRSLLPLNEVTTNNTPVPAVSTCTCTAPAGHRTKICNSCEYYEIESQTCERYPRGISMADIVKYKCGEHKIITGEQK